MKRIVLFLVATTAAAQVIPGRYIVEFRSEPAARVSASKRFSAADKAVMTRRTQIRAEHMAIEPRIAGLGGKVMGHLDTALNGVVVQLPDSNAQQLRTLPGVARIYPVRKHRPTLDHAVRAHRVTDTWAALPGGPASAGAGMKIAIFDSGIDVKHPGFQGFTASIPDGYPIACDYEVDGKGSLASCVASDAARANTNSKVIVARDYTGDADSLFTGSYIGALDIDGHGTGNAMIAAGLTSSAVYDYYLSDYATILPVPLGQITGVAPGAWLGNYKVCDDAGDGCPTDWFLQALDDAINDGMNVINYSVGGPATDLTLEGDGPEARAIRNALAAGVPVVIAAGDDGQSPYVNNVIGGGQAPGTIADPALAPDAITVGAIGNERIFDYAVCLDSSAPMTCAGSASPIEATPLDISEDVNADSYNPYDPVSGPVTDVASLDGDGFACKAFKNNSLSGRIALIQRGGGCGFDTKLNNVSDAGALGAIMYDDTPDEYFTMSLGSAVLPALFISLTDGQNVKQQVAANPAIQATIDFTGLTPFPISPDYVAAYSPVGPTPGGAIKPDLVAVGGYDAGTGDQMLTADATINEADPYRISAGTSVSAPLVTGAVAVLMTARPGLTGQQYKSLIVNSAAQPQRCQDGSTPQGGPSIPLQCADGFSPFQPQVSGTGKLDLLSATQNNVTVTPSAVNFQTGSATVNNTQVIQMTNIGSVSDTFTLAVTSLDGTVTPTVDTPTFTLDPGATQNVNVTLKGSNLPPGTYYDGYVSITGTQNAVASRAAYWFGVPGTAIQNISVLNQNSLNSGAPARTLVPIVIRYTDAIGLPINGPAPTVTVSRTNGGGRGRVAAVYGVDSDSGASYAPLTIPGTYEIDVTLAGGSGGFDEFDIAVAGLPAIQVFVPIQ